VLINVKLVYVYVKLLKILSASKKGIFVIKEKPRVIFAKCIWIGGNFNISEGWFCKHVFLTLCPVKLYIYPKVVFEMCELKCVKFFWVKW
jgi:hypothetical protein